MRSENIRCCPECLKKKIISPVERFQYEKDRYWLFCTNQDDCFFSKEFEGIAIVNKEDLIKFGLPDELLDHADIYHEDINKIVRLCVYEHIRIKYLMSSSWKECDLPAVEDLVNKIASVHDLNCLTKPARLTNYNKPYDALQELAESLVLDLSIQYRETIKAAFCKIKDYSFPEDFVNLIFCDQVPLYEILERRERKAEIDEQLRDFKRSLDLENLDYLLD